MLHKQVGTIREISRSGELITELRQVVFRKRRWLDSLLPLLAFILLNAISDVGMALIGSSGIAIVIGAYRLVRRQPWIYALGGVGWSCSRWLDRQICGRGGRLFPTGNIIWRLHCFAVLG